MRADFGVDLFANHRNQPRNSELKKPVQPGFIEAKRLLLRTLLNGLGDAGPPL
jgi:hypothetical protein